MLTTCTVNSLKVTSRMASVSDLINHEGKAIQWQCDINTVSCVVSCDMLAILLMSPGHRKAKAVNAVIRP